MKKNVFWIFLMTGILVYCPLFAEQIIFKEIKPIPRFDSFETHRKMAVGEYHGRGTIDAIDGNEVVVNDALFALSDNVKIKNSDGSPFSRQLLPGMAIYYYLDGPKRIDTIFIDK